MRIPTSTLIRIAAICVAVLVILLLTGPLRVRVVAQEPLGGHEVVQTTITTEQLLRTMRDMSYFSARDGASHAVFASRLDSLLVSHRAPDETAVSVLRTRLLREYPR